jgi:hypothetical protein
MDEIQEDVRLQIHLLVLSRFIEWFDTAFENASLWNANGPLSKDRVGDTAPHFAAAAHCMSVESVSWSGRC